MLPRPAGLHFTPDIITGLETKGVHILPVTLHVGLGTFRPVEVEDLTKHRMDSEFYHVTPEVAATANVALNLARPYDNCRGHNGSARY